MCSVAVLYSDSAVPLFSVELIDAQGMSCNSLKKKRRNNFSSEI